MIAPAGQLRATITNILNANVVSAPSFWLEILSDVVFAAGPPAAGATSNGGSADAPRGGGAGDEDEGEEDKDGRTGRSLSSSSGTRAPGRGKGPRSVREVLTAPHLRTRHYAGVAGRQLGFHDTLHVWHLAGIGVTEARGGVRYPQT